MSENSNGRSQSSPSERLRRLLIGEGFKQALVWLHDEATDATTDGQDSTGPKSAAERQSAQTKRDKENGWARCYAKAPNDPDARALVSLVAGAIESPLMRRAIRATLAHPSSVFVGEKVRGLRGIRRVVVRRLIGNSGVDSL